jgi:hypothetical protein
VTFVPTAVAIAIASAAIYDGEMHRYDDGHPTRAELVTIYAEVAKAAPVASLWCGYEIPACVASVIAHYELHNHNSRHNCDGGGPGTRKPDGEMVTRNDRSAGYFGLSAPAVEKFGTRLGYMVPHQADFVSRDLWTRACCEWLVDHPRESVWIFFAVLANNLRGSGNLYTAFSIHSKGHDGPTDYSWNARRIWLRQGWAWPKDGQLRRLS